MATSAGSNGRCTERGDRSESTAGGNGDLEKSPQEQPERRNDPFGDESGDESKSAVKYRTMHWWQAGMIMIAETVSLGILSLPSVLAAVGLVPGIILLLGLGILATYTGFVIGQFKVRYPYVHSMADAGEVMFGSIGREILSLAQLCMVVFIMGSHILTFSIMMNVITEHATCTIIFGFVGFAIQWVLTLPRTLGSVAYMSIASFISIIAAVMVTMVGVSIERPGNGIVDLTVDTTFYKGFMGITHIIFAYAGHVAFFGFISELKKPEDFVKSLWLLQGVDTTMYIVVAVVIYRYAGIDVASPALGSTGPLLQKIAYGLAAPTIVVAGVINGHVAAKFIFVRLFRGKDMMSSKSFKSWLIWGFISFVLWAIAFLIAEAIPVFGDLLGVVSALFASWFTYGLSGIFWLFMNRGRYTESWRKMVLMVVNIFIFSIGAIIMVLGLYSSSISIKANSGQSHASFSCADNFQRSGH